MEDFKLYYETDEESLPSVDEPLSSLDEVKEVEDEMSEVAVIDLEDDETEEMMLFKTVNDEEVEGEINEVEDEISEMEEEINEVEDKMSEVAVIDLEDDETDDDSVDEMMFFNSVDDEILTEAVYKYIVLEEDLPVDMSKATLINPNEFVADDRYVPQDEIHIVFVKGSERDECEAVVPQHEKRALHVEEKAGTAGDANEAVGLLSNQDTRTVIERIVESETIAAKEFSISQNKIDETTENAASVTREVELPRSEVLQPTRENILSAALTVKKVLLPSAALQLMSEIVLIETSAEKEQLMLPPNQNIKASETIENATLAPFEIFPKNFQVQLLHQRA